LPVIGIEPALKPAVAISKTGVIGVMATRGTLNSEKFRRLLESLHGNATFALQPCDGLADAIERSDGARTLALCSQYTGAMGRFGNTVGEMDCLVLGCTHYAFVTAELRALVGDPIHLLEGGLPVARHTRHLLEKGQLALPHIASLSELNFAPPAVFYSTGNLALLESAVSRWLQCSANTLALDVG
jgi:glutamate racemase